MEEKCDIENLMQYEFPTPCKYLTSGHSVTNDSSIIKVEHDGVKELLKVDYGKMLLPVAACDENLFFSLTKDAKDDLDKTLVKYDKKDNKLIEYPKVTGCIGVL